MPAPRPFPTTLLIYNTLTRRKEAFEPLHPPRVSMYSCGPTVYDYFHIGNARAFVTADMVRRYLGYRGYTVTFVQNITDIEDKIIQRAAEQGVSPAALAEKFTEVFFESVQKLGVRRADHHPRATQYVDKMIAMIADLEAKGYAYASGGDVYFRVDKFAGYGKLSGRKLEDMQSGARVEVSEQKENPLDFALWKAAKEGEPSWPSPWGPGRPGWHMECSVMSMHLLGETFDIHMGGADLIFPHHENEIAQSEAATGKPFAKYWMHNGFLTVNNEKMSKSLGNFWTIDQVLAQVDPAAVRYFLLSAHYHAPLDYSEGALREAQVSLQRLREARRNGVKAAAGTSADGEMPEAVAALYDGFHAAMDDDFNTPRALAVLFECATTANQIYNQSLKAEKAGKALDSEGRRMAAWLCSAMDALAGDVLGLSLEISEEGFGDLAGKLMELLIEVRALARKEKQFALADHIRNRLREMGIALHDRPGGKTEWERAQ